MLSPTPPPPTPALKPDGTCDLTALFSGHPIGTFSGSYRYVYVLEPHNILAAVACMQHVSLAFT